MRLIKIIIYGIFTLVTVLYFIPKTNLYYQFEHQLQPYGIVINNEHIDDKYLWLEIIDAQLYVQKIDTMHIKKSQIILFGGYNIINLEGITLATTLGQFIPKKIDTAKLRYALYDPLNINITVVGDFGKAKININLYDKFIMANIEASKLMRSKFSKTLENFTRDKKGGYHYEYRF